jgi:hypothetical protein
VVLTGYHKGAHEIIRRSEVARSAIHSRSIEIRNGRTQAVDGACEVAVRLHDEGFGGGALRLNARRHRIEQAQLRKTLRKLGTRRREVAGDGEIFRANAGELPQNIRIIEAMPDGLRLGGDVGRGPKIANIDVTPLHVDQEACRQEGFIAKPSCQELARPIEPLILCAGGEPAQLVVQDVLREIGLCIGPLSLFEGAVPLGTRRLHLGEGKGARADEADGDEQACSDAASVAAHEFRDPIGHRVGPGPDWLVREEAPQVFRECPDGGVPVRGVFFERLAENSV